MQASALSPHAAAGRVARPARCQPHPHQPRQHSARCCRAAAAPAAGTAAGGQAACSSCASRRHALALLLGAASACRLAAWPAAAAAAAEGESPAPAAAAATSSSSSAPRLVAYADAQQHYSLAVPDGWERKDKAGADVLFEDPARRSTSVGVTVSPVRVASIQQFGSLDAVGQRLLEVERRKESTLDVSLIASSTRQGAAGATLYSYEYLLTSTRGVKLILNTVTITGSRLYILNAALKCEKAEDGAAGTCATPGDTDAAQLLRAVAASFDAGE